MCALLLGLKRVEERQISGASSAWKVPIEGYLKRKACVSKRAKQIARLSKWPVHARASGSVFTLTQTYSDISPKTTALIVWTKLTTTQSLTLVTHEKWVGGALSTVTKRHSVITWIPMGHKQTAATQPEYLSRHLDVLQIIQLLRMTALRLLERK